MSSTSIVVDGLKTVEKTMNDQAEQIQRQQDAAAKAGAKALVPFVQAAVPRRKGYQRRHVRVYQVEQGVWKVKLTGHEAHLIYRDTKAHEIDPKGVDDAQVHGIRAHHRVQGPVQIKQALSWKGALHPSAHAIHRAHRGAQNPLPRVLAEHRTEAALAALEVIKRD